MSKFLKNIEGKKSLTAFDIDRIADEIQAEKNPTVIAPTPPPTVAVSIPTPSIPTPVLATREVQTENFETVALHRLTIDIPEDLFLEMKRDVKRRGKTVKNLIVSLIEAHYGRNAH